MTFAATDRKMYVPAHYQAPDVRALVNAYPFGTLITSDDGLPYATLSPMFFETEDPGETRLIGHLARRNPQAETLVAGRPALAMFTGPHAYISAKWYQERPTVPTWNYLAAQLRGVIEPLDAPDEQLAILMLTASRLERESAAPWTIEQAPPGRVDELLPRIRSFRINVESFEGAAKLNQAQPPSDRERVVAALESRAGCGDLEIARLMRDLDSDSD